MAVLHSIEGNCFVPDFVLSFSGSQDWDLCCLFLTH